MNIRFIVAESELMSVVLHKPPTPTEVAALAGVSREAVSHILGGKRAHLFSEKTRLKVKRAAVQLGYAPHRGAQVMQNGHSNLIVFLHMAGMSELVARLIGNRFRPSGAHLAAAEVLSCARTSVRCRSRGMDRRAKAQPARRSRKTKEG